jgi:hypothetical protein
MSCELGSPAPRGDDGRSGGATGVRSTNPLATKKMVVPTAGRPQWAKSQQPLARKHRCLLLASNEDEKELWCCGEKMVRNGRPQWRRHGTSSTERAYALFSDPRRRYVAVEILIPQQPDRPTTSGANPFRQGRPFPRATNTGDISTPQGSQHLGGGDVSSTYSENALDRFLLLLLLGERSRIVVEDNE